jgi:hypothetical protein
MITTATPSSIMSPTPALPVLVGCRSVVDGFHGLQVAAMTVMAMVAMLMVEGPGHGRATGQVITRTAVSLGDVVAAPAQWLLATIIFSAAGDIVWLSTLQIVLRCASALVLRL